MLRLTVWFTLLISLSANAAVHLDFHDESPDAAAAGSASRQRGAVDIDEILRQYGINQGSIKARIIFEWFDKVARDPVIGARVPGGAPALVHVLLDPEQREAMMSSGLARLTPADRSRYLVLLTRVLDELVPVNCFGLVDIVTIMNRVTIAQMSDAQAELYLDLVYKIMVSSGSSAPVRVPTREEYAAASEAMSRAVVIELGGDPANVDRYMAYTANPSTATPADVCWMTRVTLHALARMPAPERDVMLLPVFIGPPAASLADPDDQRPAQMPFPASASPPGTTMP